MTFAEGLLSDLRASYSCIKGDKNGLRKGLSESKVKFRCDGEMASRVQGSRQVSGVKMKLTFMYMQDKLLN